MLTQVQVAIHLLEAMGQLLLTGAGDRASCAPEDELKALQLVDLLREKLEPHAHERFQLLDGLISTLLGADGADEEPQQPDEPDDELDNEADQMDRDADRRDRALRGRQMQLRQVIPHSSP